MGRSIGKSLRVDSSFGTGLKVALSSTSSTGTPLLVNGATNILEEVAYSSSLVGVVGDLRLDIGKVLVILDSDSLFLEELDGLVERPVGVDG